MYLVTFIHKEYILVDTELEFCVDYFFNLCTIKILVHHIIEPIFCNEKSAIILVISAFPPNPCNLLFLLSLLAAFSISLGFSAKNWLGLSRGPKGQFPYPSKNSFTFFFFFLFMALYLGYHYLR